MTTSEISSPQRGSAMRALLVLIVAGAAVYYFFPGVRTSVNQQVDKIGGWNEEARRADPVGFIDYSIGELQKNIDKFGSVKGDLALAKAKLQKLHDDNTAKLSFSGKQLDEFKSAYKEAVGGKGWPATIAGKPYAEAELKQQVNLLLTQKGSFESVTKQTTSGLEITGKREMEIVGRVTESKEIGRAHV